MKYAVTHFNWLVWDNETDAVAIFDRAYAINLSAKRQPFARDSGRGG